MWVPVAKSMSGSGAVPSEGRPPRRPGRVRFSQSRPCAHALCCCQLAGPGTLLLPGEAWQGVRWVESGWRL